MSTLRTVNIQHPSATLPSISLDSSGAISGALPTSNRNIIINGHMALFQRSASVSGITSTQYRTVDRWLTAVDTMGTWTQTVENDGPIGSGFRKSLKMLCTTPDANPAAADVSLILQIIEGQNIQHILKGSSNARPLSLSFWTKSNVIGTYIAYLYDYDNDRMVCGSYTINQSGAWEKKSITFPPDTTGILDNDNAASFEVGFMLGAGSNFTSGALQTSWGPYVAANQCPGQVNVASSVNNYWQATGIQLEASSIPTPFEFEPYETTLRKCQRYYQKSHNDGIFPGITNQAGTAWRYTDVSKSFHSIGPINFGINMRANPTITIYSPATGATAKVRNDSDSVDVDAFALRSGHKGFGIAVSGSVNAGKDILAHWTAEAEL